MNILDELERRGSVLTDRHFVYKKKGHGPHYVNVDPIFPHMSLMGDITHQLGRPFKHDNIDTVIGAAIGGIPLAVLTAYSMPGQPCAVWADKDGDDFVFKRAGFIEQLTGKRVLVVEDLLNTGDTVKKVIAQARHHGADVIGVSAICSRGPETAESLDVPRLELLSSVDFQVFNPDECPLCEAHVPIVEDIGHGAEYKQYHPEYVGGFVKLLG